MSEQTTSTKRNSNVQLLDDLEQLTQSLYHSQAPTSTARRTASLVLPRSSVPPIVSSAADNDVIPVQEEKQQQQLNPKPRSRRMSLSPWRTRPKASALETQVDVVDHKITTANVKKKDQLIVLEANDKTDNTEKKGLWNWKPIRALSHIGMQKLSCLFSVEVVTVHGLPASMNGLRLSVCVRKKEMKDGAVQTMPSRVQKGAADFEETLFIRCHVYFSPGSATQMKFEPRPFLVYVFAVDAGELDFGKSSVDLAHLIQESVDKSFEGTRIRQWDTTFKLSGKAKGGELVLKLGFQIMEKDGGIGIYSQAEGQKSAKNGNKNNSASVARSQSKSSFSVPSPKLTSRAEAWTPSQTGTNVDLQEIEDLNLDEPAPPSPPAPQITQEALDTKMEDDFPDFDVVDKGVEIQEKEIKEEEKEIKEEKKETKEEEEEEESKERDEEHSVTREEVKEIVQEQFHQTRLTELDSIAQQIKALESMMGKGKLVYLGEESESPKLDAEEENVTKEFLQMLEHSHNKDLELDHHDANELMQDGTEDSQKEDESNDVYIPDLGKGLGCIVQTKNGGYLAAMNPLDTLMAKKDTPKLAMQISKPVVIQSKGVSGFELFQKMSALGIEEFSSEILSLMPIEELNGKTAEQIAFEGIASAIIQGRSKEGASSTAARTIAYVKSMVTAMNTGRKERILTGIWNLNEDPVPVDEVLAFALQKLEVMAVEALKIQADMNEEEAPFDVSPLEAKTTTAEEQNNHLLALAIPLEEWIKSGSAENDSLDEEDSAAMTISVIIQLRDPLRQYEAVGGPMIALLHSNPVKYKPGKYDEETRFKVASLHVGGLRVRSDSKKNPWDTEKHKLTATQWLVANGFGKVGKKGRSLASKGKEDFLWSISSRIMADMWLKPIRNPNVRLNK